MLIFRTLLRIGFLRLCKLDNQLLRLDLDARNVGVDETSVVNRDRQFKMGPNRLCDKRFDVSCRDSIYRSGLRS